MGPPVYKSPYLPPPPPIYSWTGFYVGGNGGFGGNNVNYSSTLAGVTGNTSLNSSGFLGGGQAGFNWQVAPLWVIGVETDFDGADISKQRQRLDAACFCQCRNENRLVRHGARPCRLPCHARCAPLWHRRLGLWPHDVVGQRHGSRRDELRFRAPTMQNGWTAGGGLEYAINPWLSFKTEYLYVDLGSANLSGTLGGVPIALSEKTTAGTVKAGLDFKFGGWGP